MSCPPVLRRFAALLCAMLSSPLAATETPAQTTESHADAARASGNAPLPGRRGVPLSTAAEEFLREQVATGRLTDRRIIERFGLDPATETCFQAAPSDAARGPEGTPRIPFGPGVALRPDAQTSNRSGDATCSACGFRALNQAETTIAALGNFVLAGWNDNKGNCTGGALQGFGYSVNGGATWTDAGENPPVPGIPGRWRGDPVHGVNRSTGDFYISGLYENAGVGNLNLAFIRGHFAGGAFVIDDNAEIATGGTDFLDKDWMTADPLSGNIYVTYSNFVGGTVSQIEMIRSTNNGLSWDPPVILAATGNEQGSRPAVGPNGELYVVWYEFGLPQSHMRIRRSNDFGVTFGPTQTVCAYYENDRNGAPGFRRGFGIALPSIAVDRGNGPYRGRVHVAWDEAVNYHDTPFTLTSPRSEVENNGFFASATPFTVGDVLRGSLASTGDLDLFRFTGVRGQTLYFQTDSATTGTTFNVRLTCASDTSTLNNYRFLAYSLSGFPSLVFTLPADGTYYLRLSSQLGLATYRITTAFDAPSAGERARDHRDQFAAYSDDGASWSTPARLDDSDPWYDGEYPEIVVDGSGAVHCFWHDFRDDPVCGAESYEYMVSSGNGGATWGPNRRLSDERSFWSFNSCSAANQGDYQGVTSDGDLVYSCWTDARLGDPDAWMEADAFRIGATCNTPHFVPPGTSHTIRFRVQNLGNVDGEYSWELSDTAGWITGSSPSSTGSAPVSTMGSFMVKATVTAPATCPGFASLARFIVRDVNIPGRADTCRSWIYCATSTAVLPRPRTDLFFAPPQPNPSPRGARLRFGLAREGDVRLEIFAANGALVRTLVSGRRVAGEHSVLWDGRDGRGHRMGAGVYYAALVAEGRKLGRPVVVVP